MNRPGIDIGARLISPAIEGQDLGHARRQGPARGQPLDDHRAVPGE
jgi:hypothetical protein